MRYKSQLRHSLMLPQGISFPNASLDIQDLEACKEKMDQVGFERAVLLVL